MISTGDPLVVQLGVIAEVHEQAEAEAGGFQIVEHLGAVLPAELRYGLDFQDDLVVTNEIRLEVLFQRFSFVRQLDFILIAEGNLTESQLQRETLLVDRLTETIPHFVVDLETSTNDRVRLVLVN